MFTDNLKRNSIYYIQNEVKKKESKKEEENKTSKCEI